ncbi:MAG: recombinase family protein [Anaerolineae bacterium]|nr:recombinase family protein [Anaerolineae bacterium]
MYFSGRGGERGEIDRPALDRLRDREGEGCYQVVICLSPDRLARVYMLQVLLLEEFRQAGIQMLFVNQPPVSDSPQSQLLFGIQGLFAEYERAVIAERMRRGRLHCARQGAMVNPRPHMGMITCPKQGGRRALGNQCRSQGRASNLRLVYPIRADDYSRNHRSLESRRPPTASRKCWRSSLIGNILRQTQYTGLAYNRTEKVYHEVGRLRKIGHGKRLCPVSMLRPRRMDCHSRPQHFGQGYLAHGTRTAENETSDSQCATIATTAISCAAC